MSKLIRDKIPEIALENDGAILSTHIASDDEYFSALLAKLSEETCELQEKPTDIWEYADVLEVLYSLGKLAKISPEDIENARIKKALKRWGFEKRFIWEE